MRLLKWIAIIVLVAATLLIVNYYFVQGYAKHFIVTDIKQLPKKDAALVLGTTKYVTKGKINSFYKARIEAASKVWREGKVRAIVVSGDNRTIYYNEPTQMYKDLIKAGVPVRYITRDYAGFRTLDSVVRAGVDFGLKDYIIISQPFHLSRAIYIAHAKGQDVIGFAAKGQEWSMPMLKMWIRELFARAKMMVDLYILKSEPKYWGGKVKVNYR